MKALKHKKIKTIAILGATSHIAKGLIFNFLKCGDFDLRLYARTAGKVKNFLDSIGESGNKKYIVYEGFGDFLKGDYDVVINCVGAGTSNKLQGNYSNYFTITEEYDNLAIKYLRDSRPDALYISFSSGAVYGRGFSEPVEENTVNDIRINHVAPEEYYGIAKLNAEAKHRSFKNFNIVDLRLFSYFSRFIDLSDNYFIIELLNSILDKKVFITNDINIVRDYVHPEDLFLIIKICMDAKKINDAFDVISVKPVEKKEILEYFSREYGLKYKVDLSLSHTGATGAKNVYYSKYGKAANIGYKPKFNSMDAIKEEARYILGKL